MTIAVETCLVVAMAFAVFAAITALGSSLVLGIGFERLRAGFELIKSQTGFFSEAIYKLDNRVGSVEKQGTYFFETLHKIEAAQARAQAPAAEPQPAEEISAEPCVISTHKPAQEQPRPSLSLWGASDGREISFH